MQQEGHGCFSFLEISSSSPGFWVSSRARPARAAGEAALPQGALLAVTNSRDVPKPPAELPREKRFAGGSAYKNLLLWERGSSTHRGCRFTRCNPQTREVDLLHPCAPLAAVPNALTTAGTGAQPQTPSSPPLTPVPSCPRSAVGSAGDAAVRAGFPGPGGPVAGGAAGSAAAVLPGGRCAPHGAAAQRPGAGAGAGG